MQYWWCKQHAFSIMILLLEHVTTCAYKPIALAYGLRTDDGYFIWQTFIWKNIVLEQKFRMLPTKEFYCNTGTTNLSCLSILYSLWNRLRDVVIFLGVCVYIIWFKRFMLYQHVITMKFHGTWGFVAKVPWNSIEQQVLFKCCSKNFMELWRKFHGTFWPK